MKYYLEDQTAVLEALNSNKTGLTTDEASKRLAKNGANKLPEKQSKSITKRLIEQMTDPMILVLLVAALVSATLAIFDPTESSNIIDAIIILLVVIINTALGVYQEYKAERAVDALRDMSAATSKVLRDNKMLSLPSEELVVGDIVVLEPGDRVPADGRILQTSDLQIEESVLTGESFPVRKIIEAINLKNNKDVALADRKNMVYMGGTVTYGRATIVVTATATATEIGKISKIIAQTQEEQTPLQVKLAQLSKVLTYLILAICLAVFIIQALRSNAIDIRTILDSFMIAVSLAVAAIPSALVAVVTVILSLGVTNMSKKNAIVRKLTAVETLGCTQIICTDKTGTLTQNKMTVVTSYGDDTASAQIMSLCSNVELGDDSKAIGKATEVALVEWARRLGFDENDLQSRKPRLTELPFDSRRKMMSTLHMTDTGCVQYTKGAPDILLNLCTTYFKDGKELPLTEQHRQEILEQEQKMADQALRTLACAQKIYQYKPENYSAENLENDLCFVGLCGLSDPVRPGVITAIKSCQEAGVRPIMITGDHIMTATAIAKELGIMTKKQKAVTGLELDQMSDEDLSKNLSKITVYARVQPEHKTRIVQSWQRAGYITAMTGDGVNDAPSMKVADIGIGMGITGTDVTKGVADMVLADDNFATIIRAIEEGRRIYDNLRKAIQFLLSSNTSEVVTVFFASLAGFVIFRPVQLLWINLVTDSFPALALGLEPAEANTMHKRPRDARAGFFTEGMGIDIVYQGILIAALTFLSYFIGKNISGGDMLCATTMAFLTMSFAEIFHSFNLRSQRVSIFSLTRRNKLLIISAVVSILMTSLICELPILADVFGLMSLDITQYLISSLLALCIIPLVEFVKAIQRYCKKLNCAKI